ncbi:hypothetical protein JHN49_28110 [Streptomyces sp. MBT57]|nr:hypothetical protein [Streptomyces sp. MBT57]
MVVGADGMKPASHRGVDACPAALPGVVGKVGGAFEVALVCCDPAHLSAEVGPGGEVAGFQGGFSGLLVTLARGLGHAEIVGQEADEPPGVGGQRGQFLAFDGSVAGISPVVEDLTVVRLRLMEDGLCSAEVVEDAVRGPQDPVSDHPFEVPRVTTLSRGG